MRLATALTGLINRTGAYGDVFFFVCCCGKKSTIHSGYLPLVTTTRTFRFCGYMGSAGSLVAFAKVGYIRQFIVNVVAYIYIRFLWVSGV